MTAPQDPRQHPLQDDEVALARVLRALPASEPPARLDDAILRAATDALSPGRRKPVRGLRWLPTWAVGTAAAAVLAVGVGIQLRPPLDTAGAPAASTAAAKPAPESRERFDVDLIERPAAVLPVPPPPPPAAAPPVLQRSARSAPPAPPLPAPAPVAPQPPPAPVAETAAFASEAAAPAPMIADDRQVAETADAPADAGAPPASRLRNEATDQARRNHQEAYARRAQAKAMAQADSAAAGAVSGAAILPPVADDAQLAPDAWLARIRERDRQGDTASARASLQAFVKAHPEAPIPSDLVRLR